jgi:RNA polymerase sigma factor (sigma-70 family)
VVGRPLEEAELVEGARRGDETAYGQLVQAYADIAFRTALLVTGTAAEAEEAAQDAFVKAYRALGRFRSGAPFRPWLLQIVVNEARNRRRAAGRREQLALRLADEGSSGGAAPSPEAEVIVAEQRARLLRAVAALREEERLVVSCRHFLGLSEEETATALTLPVGTVKSRLSRALARLRAELLEEGAA